MSKRRLSKLEKDEKEAHELLLKELGQEEKPGQEGPPAETPPAPAEGTPPEGTPPEATPPDVTPPVETPPIPEPGQEIKPITPPPEEDENSLTWKQKYSTLQGKYNAEVPRLQQDIKQWRDTAVTLNDKIATLEKDLDSIKEKGTIVETDADIETIAREYPDIGAVIKKVNEKNAKDNAALRAEIQRLSAQGKTDIENVARESKREMFDKRMAELGVPDWRQIDNEPEWTAFLNTSAGDFTRRPKLHFLQEAAATYDAETAAKFFLEYKALREANSAPPAPPVNAGTGKMEKYIAPPNVGSGKPPTGGAAKPIWTRDDYVRFYKETSRPGLFDPRNWGGKNESQIQTELDDLVAKGELKPAPSR